MSPEQLMEIVNILQKQICIEDCFNFLGCKTEDSIDDIRKIFYYKLQFFLAGYSNIRHYYEARGYNDKLKLEYKLQENALYHRLVSDCYLAILLYKSNNDSYKCIIEGISSFFSIQSWRKEEVYPILDSYIQNDSKEEDLYPAIDYFRELIHNNEFGTHEGLYKYTSSMMSIILLERNIIKPDAHVKVLTSKSSYFNYNPEKILIPR